MNKLLYCLMPLLLCAALTCRAQQTDIKLANEYLQQGEIDKALVMYDDLAKKDINIPFIHEDYLDALYIKNETEKAEKYLKKVLKSFPDNHLYQIDYYLHLKRTGQDSDKYYRRIVQDIFTDKAYTERTGNYLIKKGYYAEAMHFFSEARKKQRMPLWYAYELAKVYRQLNRPAETAEEVYNYTTHYLSDFESMKNELQKFIQTEKEIEAFESKLLKEVQNKPDEPVIAELLIWIYLQSLNYEDAFIQSKAYDLRFSTMGSKSYEIGLIARDNKDYRVASDIFQYLTDKFAKSPRYWEYRKNLIYCKELLVKSSYPIDSARIESLIGDYNLLARETGPGHPAGMDALRNAALLHAFYLQRRDSGIALLNKILLTPRLNIEFYNRSKIDLADIYLLNGDPWEATLLYSQVEKAMKENPVAHEAKLKNAKLAYFGGDFYYAKEHLDVLKLATSREISNDALELSLFIEDNIAEDSNLAPLAEFAAAELYEFRNQPDSAMEVLETMYTRYFLHPILDDVVFKQARLLTRTGDYVGAKEKYKEVSDKFKTGLLADDALFELGELYEFKLKDKDMAMDSYLRILMDHKSSIYSEPARKRYRKLRGDQLQ